MPTRTGTSFAQQGGGLATNVSLRAGGSGNEDDDAIIVSDSSVPPPSASFIAPRASTSSVTAATGFLFVPPTKQRPGGWTKPQDDLLIRCVRGYGLQWPKITEAYAKACKGPPRSTASLIARYKKIQAERKASSTAKKGPSQPQRASTSSASTQGRSFPSGEPPRPSLRHTQADSVLPVPEEESDHTSLSSAPSDEEDEDYVANDHHEQGQGAATSGDSSLPAMVGRYVNWTAFEDNVLIQSVQQHGRQWALVETAFYKAAPQNFRTRGALATRYRDLYKAALKKQKGAAKQHARSTSSSQTSPNNITSTPLAAGSSSSVPRSSSRPSLQGQAWTVDEEAHLLQVALKHQGVSCILDQVEAVYDGFRALYPDTGHSLESLHLKYRQLLQRRLEEQLRTVQAGEYGSAVQDEGNNDQDMSPHNNGVEGSASKESLPVAPTQEATGTSAGSTQRHAPQAMRSASFPTTVDGFETAPQTPLPSDEPTLSTIPSAGPPLFGPIPPPPPLSSQATSSFPVKTSDDSPSLLPSLDELNIDVKQTAYGYHFSRCPPNTELSIYSPTHFKLSRLPSLSTAKGKGSASSKQSSTSSSSSPSTAAPAAFIFNIVQDGSVMEMKSPAGTKTHFHIVRAAANGGQGQIGESGVGRGGPVGLEQRFVAEDGFEVVFFVPF